MQFGLRIPPCAPPQDIAAAVASAEALGFDYAWIPDSQLLWRYVWVTMAASGARTSRITLGTNVTNPVTRHVTVTVTSDSLHRVRNEGVGGSNPLVSTSCKAGRTRVSACVLSLSP